MSVIEMELMRINEAIKNGGPSVWLITRKCQIENILAEWNKSILQNQNITAK